MDADAGQTERICPSCGAQMEPENVVSSPSHLARWWRCSNVACRTEWLLPIVDNGVRHMRLWHS